MSALLLVIPADVSNLVIPAKAGIQFSRTSTKSWIPAYAGMTAVEGAA